MFNTVFFDLDNTIVQTNMLYYESFKEIFNNYEIKFSKEEWAGLTGKGIREIIEIVFVRNNKTYDQELFVEENRTNILKKIHSGNLLPVKGFLEFNSFLNSNQIPKIIVSNCNRNIATEILTALNISNEFTLIAAEDVTKRKPHPEMIQLALKLAQSKANQTILFDDAVVGIRSGKLAQVYCVGVLGQKKQNTLIQQGADIEIKDFTDNKLEQIKEFIIRGDKR